VVASVAVADRLPVDATNPDHDSGLDEVVEVVPVTRPPHAEP
jgi:hypothetical protein